MSRSTAYSPDRNVQQEMFCPFTLTVFHLVLKPYLGNSEAFCHVHGFTILCMNYVIYNNPNQCIWELTWSIPYREKNGALKTVTEPTQSFSFLDASGAHDLYQRRERCSGTQLIPWEVNRTNAKLGMVANNYNSSTLGVRGRRIEVSSKPAWDTKWFQDQPELHRESLSQERKTQRNK